jgi:hypothetical protein
MHHLLAVVGLSVACVVWFLLQRATGRLEETPEPCGAAPADEAGCAGCGAPCASREPSG